MAIAIAVIALALAIGAMGVAWRAWPRDASGKRPRRPPSSRPLARAVGVLAVLDLLAGAGLGVSFVRNGARVASLGPAHPAGTKSPTSTTSVTSPAPGEKPSRARSSAARSVPVRSSPARSVPGRSSAVPTSSSLPTTTSRRPSTRPGAKPVLIEILPPSGAAGQQVTLRGRGFFSADGHITVTFGPAEAPVACPSETTCHATVPARPRTSSATVPVRISTETGQSNPVAFNYA